MEIDGYKKYRMSSGILQIKCGDRNSWKDVACIMPDKQICGLNCHHADIGVVDGELTFKMECFRRDEKGNYRTIALESFE